MTAWKAVPRKSESRPATWTGKVWPWRCRRPSTSTKKRSWRRWKIHSRTQCRDSSQPASSPGCGGARAGEKTDLACLSLGDARVLFMPGELFVEYQLEAQRLLPDRFVAMAAYGDYGPAYIGTEVSYAQGGYETQPNSSFVAPAVEGVLTRAIAELLGVEAANVRPLR